MVSYEDALVMGSISRIFLNKWVILAIIFLILYFTGGFNIIANNPTFLVIGGLALLTIIIGGRK